MDGGRRPQARPRARRAVNAQWEAQQVGVSAVTFWECAMHCTQGRLELPHATHNWRAELIAAGLVEFPVDGEIAVLAAELDGLRGDPADRFIAATAIQRGATLYVGPKMNPAPAPFTVAHR